MLIKIPVFTSRISEAYNTPELAGKAAIAIKKVKKQIPLVKK